jgi:hypothetical protein
MASKLEQLFEEETAEFNLDYAFLSRIDLEAETQYFELVHGSHGALEPGNTVPLSKTYCRKTIADPEGTMAVSDALAEGWGDDPAYEKFGLGSYVGTTVSSENKLYGTLCFANTAPRDTPITDDEKTLIDIFGQWVSYELNQWEGPQIHDPVHGDFVQYDVPSSKIDSLMEILRDRERRVILRSLLDNTTENRLDSVIEGIDTGNRETDLHHNHLPRLEQAGYINWDKNSNTISRGPNFFEIAPLIQLLDELIGEFRG